MILHHEFLLGFGLKMAKIALNIVKVGMHSYFPNADLLERESLSCSFNRVGIKGGQNVKLVKRETSLCGFAKVGLKGGQNSLKRRESGPACLSI